MVLVLFQDPLHYLHQLSLSRVVCLSYLHLHLVEPHLDRVQLRRIGWQVHHIDPPLLSQPHRLLLVVNGTVIHNQPLLPVFILFHLIKLFKQFFDEVQVFVLSVGAFNDPPVGGSFFSDDGDQREPLPFGDGAVDCDFLVGSGPGLFPDIVEVETGLVQEVYFGSFVQQFLILSTILESFFK